TLDGHTGPVTSLAFSPDGLTLASGSLDGTDPISSSNIINTWDASVAYPEIARLVGHSREVNDLYFVPDGSRLLSRAGDEIFAWDVSTLQPLSVAGSANPPRPPVMTVEDHWVVVLPSSGRRKRLVKLPSEYEPQSEAWNVSASRSSKCIFIKCRNGNALIALLIDFSALPTFSLQN
ncbi:hypothetical protein EDB86DRAFT_2816068, partial [Lactarius hatsudake]